MNVPERIRRAAEPGVSRVFRTDDNNVIFYDQTLYHWLSLGGGIRGKSRPGTCEGHSYVWASLPETVFVRMAESGKYGKWTRTLWGYESRVDFRHNPAYAFIYSVTEQDANRSRPIPL